MEAALCPRPLPSPVPALASLGALLSHVLGSPWSACSERRLGCECRAHGECSESQQPAGDLRARSGGLSRRSEPSDYLQAAGSLSIERELCAHSPTSAQSVQAKASQAPARARPQAMPERARGWAMAVGTEQHPLRGPASASAGRLQLPGLGLQACQSLGGCVCIT